MSNPSPKCAELFGKIEFKLLKRYKKNYFLFDFGFDAIFLHFNSSCRIFYFYSTGVGRKIPRNLLTHWKMEIQVFETCSFNHLNSSFLDSHAAIHNFSLMELSHSLPSLKLSSLCFSCLRLYNLTYAFDYLSLLNI